MLRHKILSKYNTIYVKVSLYFYRNKNTRNSIIHESTLLRFYVAYILYHRRNKLAIQIIQAVFVYNAQRHKKTNKNSIPSPYSSSSALFAGNGQEGAFRGPYDTIRVSGRARPSDSDAFFLRSASEPFQTGSVR